jgi:hypothetical protein
MVIHYSRKQNVFVQVPYFCNRNPDSNGSSLGGNPNSQLPGDSSPQRAGRIQKRKFPADYSNYLLQDETLRVPYKSLSGTCWVIFITTSDHDSQLNDRNHEWHYTHQRPNKHIRPIPRIHPLLRVRTTHHHRPQSPSARWPDRPRRLRRLLAWRQRVLFH